ncbi:MAG TPA: cyclopropane-fatty-acyl-phospholipid synthase family protein [Burkholderiaceae bacterium]|nr:cyclopropane-fatty-acyl-phospholipid synthase family protein [Burkholderiaceae bacterium]
MSTATSLGSTPSSHRPLIRDALPSAARWAVKLLERVAVGALRVHFPNGQVATFGHDDVMIDLHVHDWSVFGRVLKSGDIGFAEGWIAGEWSTSDLPGLIELFARNRAALDRIVYGSWVGRLSYAINHWRNRNTRKGSRRNIHAHYDIGNSFYRLWLDPSMTYSSALFDGDTSRSLEAGQRAKNERVLRMVLGDQRCGEVLEVGCGWGGFAEAVALRGHRVRGITLSSEQLNWARERIARAGLSERASFELVDYRDVKGQYDAVVSIEMIEAVGEAWWPTYFQALHDRLKPGGRACIQSILMADELFDRYRRSTDFIQQYVFPGGMLPSKSRFIAEAQKAGFELVDVHTFGLDYAETLARWRAAFHARLPEVRALGFDDAFIRTWDFYLAYCEAGFSSGNTDVAHFTLQRR